jgi:ribosomal protein S18 acetylase RimI-like enzyme
MVTVEELADGDEVAVTALWSEVGLIRPWNDPAADYRRALGGPASAVLGLKPDLTLIGTVMVGYDGHRGWMYYLAVTPTRQRQGHGRVLVTAAERWLRERGAVKVQLMVREGNVSAQHFYERIGYAPSDVTVLARWI